MHPLNLIRFAPAEGSELDAEQQDEFVELSYEAARRLREGRWSVRLAVFPSFAAPQVIGVCGYRDGHVAVWRRWNRCIEEEKLRTPIERLRHPRQLFPTIEERVIDVATTIADFHSQLAALAIPVLPIPVSIGLDGASYDLHAEHGSHAISLRWWHNAPQEWRPLMQWFATTWRDLAERVGLPENDRRVEFPWEDSQVR